jgi:hypothetical protein
VEHQLQLKLKLCNSRTAEQQVLLPAAGLHGAEHILSPQTYLQHHGRWLLHQINSRSGGPA